jgi:hypothetical protein
MFAMQISLQLLLTRLLTYHHVWKHFQVRLFFPFEFRFLLERIQSVKLAYTIRCNPKIGYIHFWMSLIREVVCSV